MNTNLITGIQQMGVGVENVFDAWKWYYIAFGMDIKAFDDANIADFMAPYMGGKPREKRAILTVNLQGGGGFEIWQHMEHKPVKPSFEIKIGDLGIFAAKIKCKNIEKTYDYYKTAGIECVGDISENPEGDKSFFIKDPFGNYFQMVELNNWFSNENKPTGGVCGAVIGVSDITEALKVYSGILGYDTVKFEKEGIFNDFANIPGGDIKCKRILLSHKNIRTGSFSKLYGTSEIELVQVLDRKPEKMFKDRYWGDPGFIHLCFDVIGMDKLETECASKKFPYTVDSRSKNDDTSFDMGDASGHFAYIEDPDGTLIEFVEAHRLPIIKKFGWYMNLKKRNGKNLPDWMIKTLKMKRVKYSKIISV